MAEAIVKPFQDMNLPRDWIRLMGEIALQLRIEFLANGRVTALDVEPRQTVPGSERGQRIADDGVTFKSLRQRFEQSGKGDRMFNGEIETFRQRFVHHHWPML